MKVAGGNPQAPTQNDVDQGGNDDTDEEVTDVEYEEVKN